ncbi:cytochrome P450 [Nonomuraea sp. NPDC050394]|uniref:cytochrome P450 n=1 Tax=Nonomuraea sp. NPDC050394 TaxID=3364363 RepID=UPI00379E6C2C
MDLQALYRDPFPTYEAARREPGLTFVPELQSWLVSRYEDVREVLGRPEDFSSEGALRPDHLPRRAALSELVKGFGGRPAVLSRDGEEHRRLRRPLVRGLSPARVATAAPFIARRAAELVDAFAADGRVEWMSAYARPLAADVIGHLMGLDPADVRPAVEAGNRAEDLLFQPMTDDEQAAAARDIVRLQHLLDDYARARRKEPRDDLTTEMVRALAPGTALLTTEERNEIVSNLQNLLLAGHLTTTALIGSAVHHLLRDRAQWETLCARPELIPAAIEETARFEAPVQGFRRTVTRPLTFAGTELKAGDAVFVSYGSAGRDGTGGFDITRPPTRHLGFGHGVHGCPGSQLAREQLRITLEELMRRLPGIRLENPEVTMAPTLIHRAPEALHLVW